MKEWLRKKLKGWLFPELTDRSMDEVLEVVKSLEYPDSFMSSLSEKGQRTSFYLSCSMGNAVNTITLEEPFSRGELVDKVKNLYDWWMEMPKR